MISNAQIGRASEIAWVTSFLDRTLTRGGVLVISGEPGIGKSSLLAEAKDYAGTRGFLVSATNAVEAEMRLPYSGLHQLLAPFLSEVDSLPSAQKDSLSAAFGLKAGLAPEPFHISLAALNLVTTVSIGIPVLLAVDDMQWLDVASRDALGFIGRRVDADPVGIIVTVREDPSTPTISDGRQSLRLSRLGQKASKELLEINSSDLSPSEHDRILGEALGNPLALVELSKALRADRASPTDVSSTLPMTTRLERAFAGRLAELSEPARDLVLVAAVDVQGDVRELLRAASILSGAELKLDVLDDAIRAGLVRVNSSRVEFHHPLVRSAVRRYETASRQQAAHAALASVLEDGEFRQIWHRAESLVEKDDQIADALEANHVVSLSRGSVISAIEALERAAQLTTSSAQRGRRLLMAAEHAFGLGRANTVHQLLEAASQCDLTRLDRARMEWLREIFNDGVPGDAGRVLDLCEMAKSADVAGDRNLALNLLHGAALRCWWADTGPTARAKVVSEADQMHGAQHLPRHLAAVCIAEPVFRASSVQNLLSSVVLETIADCDDLRLLGEAAHATGDTVRAASFFDRAEVGMRSQGRLGLLPQVLSMQIQVQLMLGDWNRAASAAEEGRLLADETGQAIWSSSAVVGEAMLAGLRGDTERALRLADEVEIMASRRRLNVLQARVRLARAYARFSAGSAADAYEELRRTFDATDPAYHHRERFNGVMLLAETALLSGRTSEALAIIAELEQIAKITPAPVLHVQLPYARAVLAFEEPDGTLFDHAMSQNLSQWPWPEARLQLAYGLWLRRQRRIAESRVPLRAAHSTFERIGAAAWAEQARVELRASGDRTGPRGPDVHAVLSSQEVQIAKLAAEGLSNREIAERLFLSHRTVASHLYRIFPKLHVTSRSQLSSRLGLE
jgi:DNA-binding CsgD family transcriptional regulator